MRYIWTLIIVCVFLTYVTIFLYRSQSPINVDALRADFAKDNVETQDQAISYFQSSMELGIGAKYINTRNFLTFILFADSAVFSFVALVNITLDKLVFKKFYQEPDLKSALRRGILVVSCLDLLLLFKLYFGIDPFILIPVVVLFVIIEYVFTAATRRKDIVQKENADTKGEGDLL